MAHVGDLICTGSARVLNNIYAPGITTLKYSGAQTSGGYVGGTLKSNSTSEDDAITIEAGTNMTLKAYSLTNTLVLSAVDTTYSSKAAASGGTDVSLVTTGEKYTWNNKTSNTGTVTSITLKATSPIAIDSTSAITTSGTRTLSHANSGVTAGTYQSVTVNATGHVTAGSALTKAQVTTALGYTPPTSDTNNAVTQTATNTNANYEVLFSATADNTTRTEGARKYSNLLFNPSTGTLTATKFSGDISGGTGLTKSQVTTALGYTPPTSDTNTHRPIQVNGTQILGNNTTALNLKAGSNVSITNSSGTVTIAATDENVKQTATTDNNNYRVLFSYTDDATTKTEGVRRCDHFSFNPGTSALNIRGTADGQNVGLVLYTNGGVAFNPFNNDTQCGLYCSNGGGNIITRGHSDNLLTITGVTYSVSYAANFRTAIGAAASSSRLTKTNIEDLTETEAKKLLNIDVKSFDYKEAFINKTDVHRDKYYGVIAEEVINEIPYVVNVPDDYDESKIDETKGLNQNLLTVDYDKFVPYLIKMMQIQQKEINELKEKYQIPKH